MAMSGTYVREVPLKGSAEKHYKRWRSETTSSRTPLAITSKVSPSTRAIGTPTGPSSPGTTHAMGSKRCLRKGESLTTRIMSVTFRGLEGHVMEQLKVYDVIFQFIPKSEEGCVCKVTMIWEKRNEDSPEPINYMKFVTTMVADMDNHILKDQTKA